MLLYCVFKNGSKENGADFIKYNSETQTSLVNSFYLPVPFGHLEEEYEFSS